MIDARSALLPSSSPIYSDVSEAGWERVAANAALMELLAGAAAALPGLASDQRDLALCSLLTWLQVRPRRQIPLPN